MQEWLFDVRQTAHVLNTSPKKVYRMVRNGDLPHVLIGKSIRVPREALSEWIRAQTLAVEAKEVMTNMFGP